MEVEALRRVLDGRPDVRLAYVFGSLAAGLAGRASDADVAVLFTRDPAPAALDELTEALQAAVGRPIDLVNLATAPPLLAREVVATGRCLVCRDDAERARFETRAVLRYLDTAHLRKIETPISGNGWRPDVPVRPEIVRRRLLEIDEAVGHLRSWMPIPLERLEREQQLRWAVERGLQVAAEAVFDAGAHILWPRSSRRWRTSTERFRGGCSREGCCPRSRPNG
jgi:predicted nucleotidyltransferase